MKAKEGRISAHLSQCLCCQTIFWAAFAARHQLKSGPDQGPDVLRIHHLTLKEIVTPPSLSMSSTDVDAHPPRYDVEETNGTSIRQRHLARKDLLGL